MTADLELEVSLLEAEADLLEHLIKSGILPKGARREPSDVELRAGVRFAELDRIVDQAANQLLRKTEAIREAVLDGLAEKLTPLLNTDDPYEALELLDTLTDPTTGNTIPGVPEAVDRVAADVEVDLIATGQAGADEAIAEARRQGIPDHLIGPLNLDELAKAAKVHARRVALAPATKLLDAAAIGGSTAAAATGATGADVLDGALAAAESAGLKGPEDVTKQAANVAHGLGRTAGQAALPAPAQVYASELLDSNTCGPCADIDGRTYVDLDAALVDYPGAGGYIGCDGGSRCRGTLVFVHAGEATPTLDNPGHGPTGPPVDRTPKGPKNPGRPDHIDDKGNLIPAKRDTGTPAPSTLGTTLDDTGATIPPTSVDAPVETVAPDQVERDAVLAHETDEGLEEIGRNPFEDESRRIAALDELDQRRAGNRSRVWREGDLTPEELEAYERANEAWEAAGGWAADSVRAGPGRTVDKLRTQWAEELGQEEVKAEGATVGHLVDPAKAAEYRAKYGANSATLFEGPARVGYYYASPELKEYWASNTRLSFAEYAVANGVRDAKTLKRAKAAAEARQDAILKSEQSATGNEKRAQKRAEARRRKGPLTAGERLARDQRRNDRIRKAQRAADPPADT